MTSGRFERRNRYRGNPQRPWVLVRLQTPSGDGQEVPLLADTGSPFSLVLSNAAMAKLKCGAVAAASSNFGLLEGGWIRVTMPEFGIDQDLVGYANDAVARATKRSDPDFEGIVGLPFLRLFEFGGDADWFWLRSAIAQA